MDYTHGDWKVLDGAIVSSVLNDYGNFIICELPKRNSKEDTANAHLIAAAPALYEALKDIRNWLSGSSHLNDVGMHIMTLAEQALNRAEAK